jgi:hypothetical protein
MVVMVMVVDSPERVEYVHVQTKLFGLPICDPLKNTTDAGLENR